MEAIKLNMEKKLERSEEILNGKILKQKEYAYDKFYELKTQLRYPASYHSQSECKRKINEMLKEQDCFNVKINKVKVDQETNSNKFTSKINLLQENMEKAGENAKIITEIGPLNSSLAENAENELGNLSNISEISNDLSLTHPNEEVNKTEESTHPNENVHQNLGWKTPSPSTPAQDTFRTSKSKSEKTNRDQSFLYQRRAGQSNL